MAQLDYLGTWNDSWSILTEILAQREFLVYPDARPYKTPDEAQPFKDVTNELKQQLQKRSRLFLLGSFSTHPPLFHRLSSGPHEGRFYLSDSGGGPLLSLSLARDLMIDNQLTLGLGMFSSQACYELELDRWEKASQALKDAFADISKRMKRHLIRYKQSIWIGPEALALYESGRARITAVGVLQDLAKYDAKSPPPQGALNPRGRVAHQHRAAKVSGA